MGFQKNVVTFYGRKNMHQEMSNSTTKESFGEEIKYRASHLNSDSKRSPAVGGRMIEEGRIPNGTLASPRAGRRSTFDSPLAEACGTFHGKICCGGVAFLATVIFASILMADSLHTIEEGSVGLYFVQGALSDRVSPPGIHWAIPLVTNIEMVTIRPKTDTLPSISTVTRDGIQNIFNNIQVISDVDADKLVPLVRKFGLEFREALIFDRIYEELRTFCANHTVDEVYNTMFLDIVGIVKKEVEQSITRLGDNGIKLFNLVIPKPTIPADISRNYKQVKVQWTEQLVATQQQKTEKIKKETQSIKAVLDAEREKKVLEIDIQKEILRKEGEKRLSSLENEIVKEREQNKADNEKYKKTSDAEANNALFTPDFVRLEMAKSMSQNTKFFFSGESSPLGAVLTKIMGEA